MSAIAQKVVMKVLKGRAEQYQPADPHYVEVTDPKTGKKRKQKRPVPPGLSKRDERALKKIRKRAHYLDKGMNLCGFRVGWTFFIGIIPGAGDVTNAILNYSLVLRPARKLELPSDLVAKMWFNNAVSAGLGIVPVAGDIGLAAWKANSRNAHLLEAYLTIRGEEYLASQNQGQSAVPQAGMDGVSAAELRRHFGAGAGMHEDPMIGTAPALLGAAPGTAPPPLPARAVAGKKTKP